MWCIISSSQFIYTFIIFNCKRKVKKIYTFFTLQIDNASIWYAVRVRKNKKAQSLTVLLPVFIKSAECLVSRTMWWCIYIRKWFRWETSHTTDIKNIILSCLLYYSSLIHLDDKRSSSLWFLPNNLSTHFPSFSFCFLSLSFSLRTAVCLARKTLYLLVSLWYW